jgi:general secretion pathway protein A
LLSCMNNYLLARSRRGERTALVVDEAQLLSWQLLEEIPLLTSLETSQYKLLQIVLVGQPELEQKLDLKELRQLKQRVAMRFRLRPLELDEVPGYIRRRLELGGAKSHVAEIYPDETIQPVHRFSRGIPRLINTICENSLIAGCSSQAQQITSLCLEISPSSTAQQFMEPEVLVLSAQMVAEKGKIPAISRPNFKTESDAKTL